MTNSEEPSAPDGISTMKVSENFGTQQHQLHQHTFSNYANGDLKENSSSNRNGTNGTSLACTGSDNNSAGGGGTMMLAYASSSCSSSSSSSGSNNNPAAEPNNCNILAVANSNSFSHSHHQNQHQQQPPLSSINTTTTTLAVVTNSHQHQQQIQPLPFTLICGEYLQHKTEVSDGSLVLTNYRLFLQTKESIYNLPLGLLESVECRDIFFLHLNCKDARCIRCTFPNNEAALEMLKRIQIAISPTKKVEDNFAFTFYKKTKEGVSEEIKSHLGWDLPSFPTPKERFDAEVKRMEFNVQGPWRVSDENKDYELCNSYPTHIIVPCVMDKKKLEQVACFRSARRFPAVVWR